MKRCDRCGGEIPRDTTGYHIWLWIVAGVTTEIDRYEETSVTELAEELDYRLGAMPEYLVTSDMHARRSYFICPHCKEILLANPLGKKISPG